MRIPFQKYPHLCTRIGKITLAKSTFHNTFHPKQHKGRRVPLHLIDKVEKELNKLIEDKQIIKIRQMFPRILYQSNSNHSKTRQIHKNSIRFKKIERRDTQKQIPDAEHRPPYGYDSIQNK